MLLETPPSSVPCLLVTTWPLVSMSSPSPNHHHLTPVPQFLQVVQVPFYRSVDTHSNIMIACTMWIANVPTEKPGISCIVITERYYTLDTLWQKTRRRMFGECFRTAHCHRRNKARILVWSSKDRFCLLAGVRCWISVPLVLLLWQHHHCGW